MYICAEYDIVDPKKIIVRQRYDMERIQLQDNKRDLAVLVGLRSPVLQEDSTDEESLEELSALVETAGGQVVGSILQSRDKPDPHSFIGEGKVAEIKGRKVVVELKVLAAGKVCATGSAVMVQLKEP